MNNSLDMSLDDIIQGNKQVGRGRGRGAVSRRVGYGDTRTAGPLRVWRAPARASTRPSPYQLAKPFSRAADTWQHDIFEDAIGNAARSVGIGTGTKLYISNLDYGVSNDDIKELFSELGDLKRCAVHYDRSGRSKGTAEVLFARKLDALAAMKRYNNVSLDGKHMKIEVIGTNFQLPALQALNGVGVTVGRGRPVAMIGEGRGRGFGYRGFGGRRRGRGRGRGRGQRLTSDRNPMSVEELDKDLDKYHQDAMQMF